MFATLWMECGWYAGNSLHDDCPQPESAATAPAKADGTESRAD